MEVGIRELRTNLAAIMDEVDKGTIVTITHHGRPRATIQPVASELTPVERGLRDGWLSAGPAHGAPRVVRHPAAALGRADGRRAWTALMDDRGVDR